jgi:hypothetical protein
MILKWSITTVMAILVPCVAMEEDVLLPLQLELGILKVMRNVSFVAIDGPHEAVVYARFF